MNSRGKSLAEDGVSRLKLPEVSADKTEQQLIIRTK